MEKEITNQYPKIFTDEEFREALKIAKQSGPSTIRFDTLINGHIIRKRTEDGWVIKNQFGIAMKIFDLMDQFIMHSIPTGKRNLHIVTIAEKRDDDTVELRHKYIINSARTYELHADCILTRKWSGLITKKKQEEKRPLKVSKLFSPEWIPTKETDPPKTAFMIVCDYCELMESQFKLVIPKKCINDHGFRLGESKSYLQEVYAKSIMESNFGSSHAKCRYGTHLYPPPRMNVYKNLYRFIKRNKWIGDDFDMLLIAKLVEELEDAMHL